MNVVRLNLIIMLNVIKEYKELSLSISIQLVRFKKCIILAINVEASYKIVAFHITCLVLFL